MKLKQKINKVMKTKCCNTRHAHQDDNNNIICTNTDCQNYLGATELMHERNNWKNKAAISLFIFYVLFSFDDFSMVNKEANVNSILFAPRAEEAPLTAENLQKELEAQHVICPREVLAQIRLESGHFNSFLLKRTNNMLGMRFPFTRKTTSCGIYIASMDTIIYGTQAELKKYHKTNHYAVFNTWKDAVADYKLWQEACFKVSERYLTFLGNVYAEDSLYTKKIKRVVAMANEN
jgi:mannosyl-glycoprotein endo-beta-N-acetylglucosaminidase